MEILINYRFNIYLEYVSLEEVCVIVLYQHNMIYRSTRIFWHSAILWPNKPNKRLNINASIPYNSCFLYFPSKPTSFVPFSSYALFSSFGTLWFGIRILSGALPHACSASKKAVIYQWTNKRTQKVQQNEHWHTRMQGLEDGRTKQQYQQIRLAQNHQVSPASIRFGELFWILSFPLDPYPLAVPKTILSQDVEIFHYRSSIVRHFVSLHILCVFNVIPWKKTRRK